MIRALSLSAALALLPLSTALAAESAPTPDQSGFEAAAESFGLRMAAFGARAEAIGSDESLTEEERDARIAAAWAEYQPEVTAFTAAASSYAASAAAEALADIDVEALVANALADVDIDDALATASGLAANSAWTNPDEETMVTYGLVAQYGLNEALDEVADTDVETDTAD